MFELALRLGTDLEKQGRTLTKKIRSATIIGIKVEAFRLRKEGRKDLRLGNLGMEVLSPLRKRHGKKTRKSKPKAPLKSFSRGIVYKMDYANLTARVGFVGTTAGTSWQAKVVEKSIPGYRIMLTPARIKKLHEFGIHIKKQTTSSQVPQRDIINQILKKQGHGRIVANIENNIARKLRGERI